MKPHYKVLLYASLISLVLLLLTSCKQVSTTSTPTSTPTAGPTTSALVSLPQDIAREEIIKRSGATDDTSPPTPTPIPLPRVCLRPEFSSDQVDCGNVPHYDIDLTVVLTAAQVWGHEEIRYTNLETEALNDLYLRLFPNTPGYGGNMKVSNLLLDGESVPTVITLTGTALHIPLSSPLEVGQSRELSLDYVIDVPTHGGQGHGLFSYQRGVMAIPTAYALIPVYNEEGWQLSIAPEYGDDVFADVALYDVTITAPAGLTLIASGACTASSVDVDRWLWSCEAGPMRDFALILGENYQRASLKVGGVVVNSYYYTQHESAGRHVLGVAADALSAFSEQFGPYPYTELDVVETPNYLGGMEYPGLVVVEDTLYPGQARIEWLTAHEVAHQWWFGVVGNDPIQEPWLDEALTQYSTMLYYEAIYGEDRAAAIRNAEFVAVHNRLQQQGRNLPVGLPASEYGPSLYWQIVYDKGALYFHELRETVGDEAFFEILQTYYAQHRYRIASPETFLDTVQEVTGSRYTQLFETWVGDAP